MIRSVFIQTIRGATVFVALGFLVVYVLQASGRLSLFAAEAPTDAPSTASGTPAPPLSQVISQPAPAPGGDYLGNPIKMSIEQPPARLAVLTSSKSGVIAPVVATVLPTSKSGSLSAVAARTFFPDAAGAQHAAYFSGSKSMVINRVVEPLLNPALGMPGTPGPPASALRLISGPVALQKKSSGYLDRPISIARPPFAAKQPSNPRFEALLNIGDPGLTVYPGAWQWQWVVDPEASPSGWKIP
jgi:hypothetical protein